MDGAVTETCCPHPVYTVLCGISGHESQISGERAHGRPTAMIFGQNIMTCMHLGQTNVSPLFDVLQK